MASRQLDNQITVIRFRIFSALTVRRFIGFNTAQRAIRGPGDGHVRFLGAISQSKRSASSLPYYGPNPLNDLSRFHRDGPKWLRRGSLRVLRTLIWPLAFAAMTMPEPPHSRTCPTERPCPTCCFPPPWLGIRSASCLGGTALRAAAIRRAKVGYEQIQRQNKMALSATHALSISRMSRGLDQSAMVPIVASAPLLLLRTSANLYASCL
jgi:hypothetical protein